jgi:hypothetical protein
MVFKNNNLNNTITFLGGNTDRVIFTDLFESSGSDTILSVLDLDELLELLESYS